MSGKRFIVPEDTARRQREASDPSGSAWWAPMPDPARPMY